jgi:hypothetical protein
VTISGTASDVGGVVAGVEVSTDGGATWHPAMGLANWNYGWTTGAGGSVTIRSRAVDDTGNLESPSAGVTVNVGTQPTSTPTATATPTPTPTRTPMSGPTSTPTLTPTATPTPRAGAQTLTFDDLSSPNRVLNGQYPTGLADWGTNVWWLSSPWGMFTTNSVSFNGSGLTSGSITFLSPRRLVQLDAYNGGTGSSTITLACPGQPTRSVVIAANQLLTIATNWTATCSSLTITSTNGWWTNFDNMAIDAGP